MNLRENKEHEKGYREEGGEYLCMFYLYKV